MAVIESMAPWSIEGSVLSVKHILSVIGLLVAIAIAVNWEIAEWSSSFGSAAMSHFMSPSLLMAVNQAVTQPIGFVNNSLLSNPSGNSGMAILMT